MSMITPEDYQEPRCLLNMDADAPAVEPIPLGRAMDKLDEYLNKNDYDGAMRHLEYWLAEAVRGRDKRSEFSLSNEKMGLCRKTGRREEALAALDRALALCEELDYGNTVGGGTCFVNCATVYTAFDLPEKALPLFRRAQSVYEKTLDNADSRLGSLYNNMALCLVELGQSEDAFACYAKALDVMGRAENGALEQAITYLNMANAVEDCIGMEEGIERIEDYVARARELLETPSLPHNGYYAFVCEKCAPTFDYYGEFMYAAQLKERAGRIYAGT